MSTEFFHLDEHNGLITLNLKGEWTVANFAQLEREFKRGLKHELKRYVPRETSLNVEHISQLDTAGILQIVDLCGVNSLVQSVERSSTISPERRKMIHTVLAALPEEEECHPKPARWSLTDYLANVGKATISLKNESLHWFGFLGLVLERFFSLMFQPHKWRITSVVANIDNSGLKAAPIVMLLCFMVGAVVAFLGATVLQTFGAEVFAVHLVAYSFLREFAIILTAILMAGRTASAFTAQIGSMKVNQEIDALQASGSDPIALIVVPRVVALLVSMPLLTFLGMMAGIVGGMLVCAVSLNISPNLFFEILSTKIAVKHFLVGIAKAPLMAIVIAVTGCIEGFKVSGSAESVGHHTTASVVKCIFLVILLDALCAIFYMEMGW
ncbi:MAG: ABC transporter permease [Pelistega sp.]|nr:ABC transporter permease [Pelistega sp.]